MAALSGCDICLWGLLCPGLRGSGLTSRSCLETLGCNVECQGCQGGGAVTGHLSREQALPENGEKEVWAEQKGALSEVVSAVGAEQALFSGH